MPSHNPDGVVQIGSVNAKASQSPGSMILWILRKTSGLFSFNYASFCGCEVPGEFSRGSRQRFRPIASIVRSPVETARLSHQMFDGRSLPGRQHTRPCIGRRCRSP